MQQLRYASAIETKNKKVPEFSSGKSAEDWILSDVIGTLLVHSTLSVIVLQSS